MILLALFLAIAQPNVATLEDVCIGGATEFTNELDISLPCPSDPPLGWDIGNSFAKDGCTNDALASDGACYAAYLRQLLTIETAFLTPEEQGQIFRLICDGPAVIADNDPGLTLFEGPHDYQVVALTAARAHLCNRESAHDRR